MSPPNISRIELPRANQLDVTAMVTVRTLCEATYRALRCFSLRSLWWGKKVPTAEWSRQAFLVSHGVSGFVNLYTHIKHNSCSWGGNKDKSTGVLWHFPSSNFRGQHLALDINFPGSFAGRKCCMLITQWRTNCCSTLNELWVIQETIFLSLSDLPFSSFRPFQFCVFKHRKISMLTI